MYCYIVRKFLVWTVVFLLFLTVVLTASVYLQAFVSYQPLPLGLVLSVAALQLTDSLRFGCCLAAFCLAAAAVERRQIMLMRSTGGGAGMLLSPLVMSSVTVVAFCVFFESFAVPPIRAGLFKAERAALVEGMRDGMARTGQFRAGRAAFTAGRVEGNVMHSPLCYVGDLLIRGATLTAGDDEAVVADAEIRDVHGGRTFKAGSFVVRFPSEPVPGTGRERWARRPWRAYRGMCRALSLIPLVLLGLVAGVLVGRVGQMKAFLILLFLTFVLYLGGEKALLDLARRDLGVEGGWVTYLWGVLVAVVGLPAAVRAVRSRAALGEGA
jgi:lipopolysaccharide export LptBFGC system permease protein LptF